SQVRLSEDNVLRLAPDAVPDRVERGELRTLRIDLMHCHGCSRKFTDLVAIIARRADGCPRKVSAKKTPAECRGASRRWSTVSGNQTGRLRTIGKLRQATHSVDAGIMSDSHSITQM